MNVDIWSDVVCPWCYIGKRRFEHALARFEHRDEVRVVWRSFELDPTTPRDAGEKLDEHLSRKYGVSLEQAAAMNARVSALAADVGLEYHLDRARLGNTFDAHRLIHFAARDGRAAAMKERLMAAYFTEGRPIGERETLASLAAEVGIEGGAARAMLESDELADAVRADEESAARYGITGVPFFLLHERYGVSGAQSEELFLEALERTWSETRPQGQPAR